MTIIKDTFFGGAEKKAAQAQERGIERGIQATERAAAQARGDLFNLFPQARQDVMQGFQGALDVFGQTIPQQTQAFQQGNVGAQQALLAGLPQIQNALLGMPVDFSGFNPLSINVDTGFASQNLGQVPLAPVEVTTPNIQGSATPTQLLQRLGLN